jgi:hypothetical protein
LVFSAHFFISPFVPKNYREVKNMLFLGLMAYLVFKGVWKEVNIRFLIPGHTHGLVDQKFSRISSHHNFRNMLSFVHYISQLWNPVWRKSKKMPNLIFLGQCWNLKDWIKPCLDPSLRKASFGDMCWYNLFCFPIFSLNLLIFF